MNRKKKRVRHVKAALSGRLMRYADDYIAAVCEVVLLAHDGTSHRRRQMLEGALRFRADIDSLLSEVSE